MSGQNTTKGRKIKYQIMILFLCSIIIPVWLLGAFSIMQLRKKMVDYNQSLVQADCVRINSTLFDITTSIYTSTEYITNNVSYMEFLGSDYTTKYKEAYDACETALSHIHKDMAAVSSLALYTDNPSIPEGSYIKYIQNYDNEEWYKVLPDGCRESWLFVNHTNSRGQQVSELCLIRRMGTISPAYNTYLVIFLDNNNLKNRLNPGSFQVSVSLNDIVFYSTQSADINTLMKFPEDKSDNYCNFSGTMETNNEKTITSIITYKSYRTNNFFYVRVDDSDAYTEINNITITYIFFIIFLTFIPAIVIFKYSTYFSNRVTTLKSAMHQASLGDYNIIDSFEGSDDELATTFEDLKSTVNIVQQKEAHYYNALIDKQKLINKQQQMEYNMLASQINPHFLYNTLETIRMQALAAGNKDVATSIKLLGKSMHYVLENTGTTRTTLSKELDYVKTYLSIQHLRFQDRVNSEITISPELNTDNIQILPLLIQPIVENAIVHGLENASGTGYITITVEDVSGLLHIVISDNGCGVSEDELKRVIHNMNHHESNSQSIGLYNINKRIKLFYGDEYGLNLSSDDRHGFTVIIDLPYSPVNDI
ncbi:MAG: sensor histidine kinase [Coprococcus sp.]